MGWTELQFTSEIQFIWFKFMIVKFTDLKNQQWQQQQTIYDVTSPQWIC